MQGVLLVVIVSAAVFVLLSAAGGDALSGLRDNPQVSAETIERLRVYYGLDRPVGERYFRWAADAVRGDLGESISFRTSVASIVGMRLLETLKLSAVTLAIALFVSLLLSFLVVRTRSRMLDRLSEIIVLLFASTPVIVTSLAVLAMIAAASTLSSGSSIFYSAAALAPPFIALFAAQSKRSLAAAMQEDFVQLARSKGLSETAVILRHAARAALNPLITLTGLSIGALVSGSVIVETVLGRQGIGALTVAAVRSRDVPLVMG
ncbi:MAG: ABC transporter permease, partial [Pyrinomonadaceae bacterium]|nr:ABC transporter permease [Pyrinomonadaceae bacterium]